MHYSNDPQVSGPVIDKGKQQANAEYGNENPEVLRIIRISEMVKMQGTKREQQITGSNAQNHPKTPYQLCLQQSTIHEFLKKPPQQGRYQYCHHQVHWVGFLDKQLNFGKQ